MSKKAASSNLWSRYLLIGAAIGLYFGYFFRPVREPSLLLAMLLATIIALVLPLLSLLRGERPGMAALLQQIAVNLVKYGLILIVFEARHWAFDWGGRAAVMIMTTLFGALFGAWLAYEQTTKSADSIERPK